jgi:CDP-diacylglycerol--glycerol-3-phosphate 3-phosphatidyltransferase
MTGRIWTISNALSLSRVMLAVPIAYFLLRGDETGRWLAVVLMGAAMLTDFFDGLLARWLNQVTDLGKILDPFADKVAMGVVVFVLTLQGVVPEWFFLAAVVRDLLIMLGGLYVKRRRGVLLQSNIVGKWTVTATAVFVILATLQIDSVGAYLLEMILLYTSTLLLGISLIVYTNRFFSLMKEGGNRGVA